MESLIGKRLGQYEIVSKIGAGGMAIVYLAKQTSVDREVAIKVIRGDMTDDPDFVMRFQREARTIAQLRHPHILKLFDFGNESSLAYLVMELMDGGSLSKLIRAEGVLPIELAGRMLDQIASALDYAHQNGIIHRDLKPDNVLLDKQRNVFLTDFGIAKLLNEKSNITRTGMVMGTPAYMAPELWSGSPADTRTDIYALGVILYEMLTAKSPFMADTPFRSMHMHIYEPAPLVASLNPAIPHEIDGILARALAKDREQRFNSAGEMAIAFKTILRGFGMTMFPTPRGGGVPRQGAIPGTPPTPGAQGMPMPQSQTPYGASRQPTRQSGQPGIPPDATAPAFPSQGSAGYNQYGRAPIGMPTPLPTQATEQRKGKAGLLVVAAVIVILLGVIGVLLVTNNQRQSTSQNETAAAQAALFGTSTQAVAQFSGTQTAAVVAAEQTQTQIVALASLATATPKIVVFGSPSPEKPTGSTATAEAIALVATQTPLPGSTTIAATVTATLTATSTNTATLTFTPTSTNTATLTETPTFTFTPTPTFTETFTPTATDTFTPTVDVAVLIAQTLAPLQTQTAIAQDIQKTVDAVLAAGNATAAAMQTATQDARLTSEAIEAAFQATNASIQTQVAAIQATSIKATINANAALVLRAQRTATALAKTLNAPTRTPTRVLRLPTTAAPSVVQCPGFLPSRLIIGQTARITPGDPNRLRTAPSVSGSFIVSMPGGSVITILSGPECGYSSNGQGIAWWLVRYTESSSGRTYEGWTAEGQGSIYWIEPLGGVVVSTAVRVTAVRVRTPPPTNQRTTIPSGSVRLGEFQVESYCNGRGYGIVLTNGNRDWACTNSSTGRIIFVLSATDFDAICVSRYGTGAFAIRDMSNAIQAYNWSCYRWR